MWQPIDPTAPASLTAIEQQQAPVVNAIAAHISTANAALTNAAAKTALGVNSQAGSAAPLMSLRANISQLINTTGSCLVVHPWQQDVGTGDGIYRWLSPQAANTRMVEKLRGVLDERQPGNTSEAVAVMLFATGLAEFAEQLQHFNAVFPVPELQMIQRRCSASISHESNKLQQIDAPQNPHWNHHASADLATVRALDSTLGALQSQIDSLGADTNPITELQAVASKKSAAVASYQQAWDAIDASLTGGAGVVAFMQGNLYSIADQLEQNTPAGYEYPLAAGVIWLGDDLTLLKEVLLT